MPFSYRQPAKDGGIYPEDIGAQFKVHVVVNEDKEGNRQVMCPQITFTHRVSGPGKDVRKVFGFDVMTPYGPVKTVMCDAHGKGKECQCEGCSTSAEFIWQKYAAKLAEELRPKDMRAEGQEE